MAAGRPQLDQAAIRARLEAITRDLRSSLSDGATETREAVLALLAEDDHGRRRLDVRADPEAPGGYRIEGDWVVELPVNEETPTEADPDRRFRRLVAGARYARVCALPMPLGLRVSGG